jgi:hypothetical protein
MSDRSTYSKFVWRLAALAVVLVSGTGALAQGACRPTIAFAEPHYSAMQLPKIERTWTAVFSADPSRCATSSGTLTLVFTVWSESAPDFELDQTFEWMPDVNVISKDFRLDEAVGAYRIEVAPCPCRN